MTEAFAKQIEAEARQAMTELVAAAKLKKGDVLVVGCSSSEMVGGHIGKDSSIEAARALYAGAAPVLAEKGIWLAAQCCEHLNRALILEREAAEKYGWEEVCVVPRPHAGGSWATTCWKNFKDPVAVEEIRANAGMDIGGTLIGMHLKRVAVPVRLSLNKIGEANILCAYTRPKCGRPWPRSGKRWPQPPGKPGATRQRCSCAPPARPARHRPLQPVRLCPLMCLAKTMCRSCAQTTMPELTAVSPAILSAICRPIRSKRCWGGQA